MNPDIDITLTDDGVEVVISKDMHLENAEYMRQWWIALSQSKFKTYKELGEVCKRVAKIEWELSR